MRWKRSARSLGSSQPSVAMRVPDAVDHLVAHVEEAGSLWRLQPLVRAGGVHVAADLVHVELHHARHVRAIDGGENSLGARQRAEFFCRQHHAGHGRDVAEEHHLAFAA